MGNSQFVPKISNPKFFAIDFLRYDEMRIIYCVKEIESILRNVIYRKSPGGVQHVSKPSDSVLIYTFRGRPFAGITSSSAIIEMNRFICAVLEELLMNGWVLRAGVNFIKTSKRTTYIFERISEAQRIPLAGANSLVAIAFSSTNKLLLMNDNCGLQSIFDSEIRKNWSKGLESCKRIGGDNYKFKCYGNLWSIKEVKEALPESRHLVLNVLNRLHEEGIAVYGNGHPCSSSRTVDFLYFTRHAKLDSLGNNFMLGLWRSNKLYLVKATPVVEDIVRRCIISVWEPGIDREERLRHSMLIFKLRAKPWAATKLLGMRARFLILRLLDEFCSTGWRLYSTVDMCHIAADVSAFVLYETQPEARSYMAIGLHRGDRIRLINAPTETVRHFRENMIELWPEAVMGSDEYMGCPELVLPNVIHSCIGLFCIIFDLLKRLGWNLVSSADLSSTYSCDDSSEYPSDLHTLIFERKADEVFYDESQGACGGRRD